MNKFYYIDGKEVKEIETVKDLDFIQEKTKHKNAVKAKKDLQPPEGYAIKDNKVEPTAAKQAELDELQATQEKELLIQNKLRQMAIDALIVDGLWAE